MAFWCSFIFRLFTSASILFFLIDNFEGLGEDGTHLQILHPAAMLEHSARPLKASAFDLDLVATDAAAWLLHVQVETVDHSQLVVVSMEGFLSCCRVQVTELDGTEGEWSGGFLGESLGKVFRVIKVQVTIVALSCHF